MSDVTLTHFYQEMDWNGRELCKTKRNQYTKHSSHTRRSKHPSLARTIAFLTTPPCPIETIFSRFLPRIYIHQLPMSLWIMSRCKKKIKKALCFFSRGQFRLWLISVDIGILRIRSYFFEIFVITAPFRITAVSYITHVQSLYS